MEARVSIYGNQNSVFFFYHIDLLTVNECRYKWLQWLMNYLFMSLDLLYLFFSWWQRLIAYVKKNKTCNEDLFSQGRFIHYFVLLSLLNNVPVGSLRLFRERVNKIVSKLVGLHRAFYLICFSHARVPM